MPPKHPRTDASAYSSSPPPPPHHHHHPHKRVRLSSPSHALDLLSPLSDELLIRILSYLSLPHLLAVAPVSRRYHRLAEDSQLWKALYYARFVLPRAMRIPGFRGKASVREHKLHYKGRRTLWADGRLGGLVRRDQEKAEEVERGAADYPATRLRVVQRKRADQRREGSKGKEQEDQDEDEGEDDQDTRVDWKRQFKIRHNWARGKCAVEELKLGPDPEARDGILENDHDNDNDHEDRSKMLVKVVEGLAVTADAAFGLRAWDLKTREVVAHAPLHDAPHQDEPADEPADESAPSCIAVDDRGLDKGILGISVGFADGSFGVWRLGADRILVRRYRHEKSSNGELVGMAYSHPYLLTATGAVLVSLYTFHVPQKPQADSDHEDDKDDDDDDGNLPVPAWLLASDPVQADTPDKHEHKHKIKHTRSDAVALSAPFLMTSLRSHTSDPPLALSIRTTGSITVASITYTFFTRQGWAIGIQDLHITPNLTSPSRPPDITTRLAHTPIVQTGPPRTAHELSAAADASQGQTQAHTYPRTRTRTHARLLAYPSAQPSAPTTATRAHAGPTTLSYTHPYLLATLPDNTLVLHLCTSTASALSISPGIRLWGHTSGISDADITARGKAVSVSSRGEEMRVWELEGRSSGLRSKSVEIRAGAKKEGDGVGACGVDDWEERRNWVGFDDEMVIVLKEARGGRESLMVYDFT